VSQVDQSVVISDVRTGKAVQTIALGEGSVAAVDFTHSHIICGTGKGKMFLLGH
jgi:hypothetical protein